MLQLEVAERLVPGELGAVALPVLLGQVERGLFPVIVADLRKRVGARVLRTATRYDREAEFGVLLPVPVRQ
jgi:hypothetical protein